MKPHLIKNNEKSLFFKHFCTKNAKPYFVQNTKPRLDPSLKPELTQNMKSELDQNLKPYDYFFVYKTCTVLDTKFEPIWVQKMMGFGPEI